MWKRERNRKRKGCMRRTKMTRNRYRKKNNSMMRIKIMWKRERKIDIKVKRAGRENMNQKLTGTTSMRPSLYGHKLEGKDYY